MSNTPRRSVRRSGRCGNITYAAAFLLALSCATRGAQCTVTQLIPQLLADVKWVPDTITVCTSAYWPFILPAVTVDQYGNPLAIDVLNGPNNGTFVSGPISNMSVGVGLGGYDIEYLMLLLGPGGILNRTLVFKVFPGFGGAFLALRQRKCSIVFGGVGLNSDFLSCNSNCPNITGTDLYSKAAATNTDGTGIGDYADVGMGYEAQGVCCLQYSVSYFSSGFSLLSTMAQSKVDVVTTMSNNGIINSVLTLISGAFAAGWIFWLMEGGVNDRFTGVETGVYWAMTVLTTVGFGDVFPTTRLGQALASTWGVFSVILTAIFTSLITSDFSSTVLKQPTLLDSLTALDPTSFVCIEKDVAALQQWITYSLDPTIRRDFKALADCVMGVQSGVYTAAISDAPRLTWFANFYTLENAHVSPALTFSPFAYAFNNDDQLSNVLSRLLLIVGTDPSYSPLAKRLYSRYFSQVITTPISNDVQLSRSLVIIVLVLASGTLVTSLGQAFLRSRRKRAAAAAKLEGHSLPQNLGTVANWILGQDSVAEVYGIPIMPPDWAALSPPCRGVAADTEQGGKGSAGGPGGAADGGALWPKGIHREGGPVYAGMPHSEQNGHPAGHPHEGHAHPRISDAGDGHHYDGYHQDHPGPGVRSKLKRGLSRMDTMAREMHRSQSGGSIGDSDHEEPLLGAEDGKGSARGQVASAGKADGLDNRKPGVAW